MGQASIDDIVSNAGPAAATPPPAATAAPVSGTAHVDDIVSNQGPAPAAPADNTSTLSKVGDWAKGTGEGAVESMGETIQSLPWVGKKIISPEAMQAERAYFRPGTNAEKYGQTTGDIAEPVLEFVLGDEALKGLALTEKMGIAAKIAKIAQDSPYIGKLLQHGVNAARMGTVGAAEAKAKGASNADAVKAGLIAGVGGEAIPAIGSTADAVAARVPAVASAVDAVTTRLTNPFKKLLTTPKEAGAAATQEPAAAAVRTVTGAPAGTAIVDRAAGTTAADDLLAKTGVQKDFAYKRIDDTVGFDLKAEKQKLADTKYAIKQPGADVKSLQAEMDLSNQKIADANAKLVKAGINPKDADNLNTAWEATKLFKQDIVKATKADGTIDVNALLKRANSRFNPRYGDRLAQAFGKGDAAAGKVIANNYIKGLEAAQAAGQSALKSQRFKLWLTGLVGGAAITTGGVEGVKALLAP